MQSHCWQHIAQAQAKLFVQYIRQALDRGVLLEIRRPFVGELTVSSLVHIPSMSHSETWQQLLPLSPRTNRKRGLLAKRNRQQRRIETK
jgi:hypothetical protein